MSKQRRNDPCQCGSGHKYKRCCLLKEQERKRMEAVLKESLTKNINKPTEEQAARWLTRYVNQRITMHNATVQHLSQLECALNNLPQSSERDFALRDVQWRLNELVGNALSKETRVLQALANVAQNVQHLIPAEPPIKAIGPTETGEPLNPETKDNVTGNGGTQSAPTENEPPIDDDPDDLEMNPAGEKDGI
jgi:hypothetical protein